MRDPEAWAAHNAVIIQTEWRRHAARRELAARRGRRTEQRAIVNKLRPFFIEMYNLPEKVVRPSGHKLLDKLIIQEVCKDTADLLGAEATGALRSKVAALAEEKASRQATLDKMHHTLAIHWRLMQLPEERWLELPPAGAALTPGPQSPSCLISLQVTVPVEYDITSDSTRPTLNPPSYL